MKFRIFAWLGGILLAFGVASLFVYLASQTVACHERGGEYVRTVWGTYHCLAPKEL